MYPPVDAGSAAYGQRSGFIRETRVPAGRPTWGECTPKWPNQLAQSPALVLPSVRREWLDAGLTCAGAVLGWFTPLLLQQVDIGSGGNFYDYGEDVLCPLFACFGAGLGLMSGALGGTAQRGVANGERTVAG